MSSATRSADLLTHLTTPDLLDALADGAYVTDCERRILFWNRAAERMLGWTSADMVGRTCFDDLLVHVDKDGHRLCGHDHCPLHRSIVTGTPSRAPLLVFAQSKQGNRVPVEVSVAPVTNAAGRVVGGIELFRDLSEGMRDLWRAKQIQDVALECPLPADERVEIECCYQPQEMVGGDFYRIERCDPDHYVTLLADVMGHGVASALYTMQLRSLWEDHREDLASPARFLEVLNRRLHTLVRESDYFASAVCVRYNAATGDLRYVRAGHPAPLLIRAGAVVPCAGKPQPALGMLAGTVYAESDVHIEPGEALLLYTDGAVEITNTAGQDLQVEGLTRLLRAAIADGGGTRVLPRLEAELVRYCGEIRLPDDLALIQVRRRPMPAVASS